MKHTIASERARILRLERIRLRRIARDTLFARNEYRLAGVVVGNRLA